jgi:hypothetical protein
VPGWRKASEGNSEINCRSLPMEPHAGRRTNDFSMSAREQLKDLKRLIRFRWFPESDMIRCALTLTSCNGRFWNTWRHG